MAMLLAATLAVAAAQDPAPPRRADSLALGMLVQVVGDYQSERVAGQSGFSIANARVKLTGTVSRGFGYLLQANVLNNPAILDAALSYRFGRATLRAGVFKAPFSREFLTGAGAIDFVNRSQVVTALAPNRDVGVALGGRTREGTLEYSLGLFNGNRSPGAGNDNDAVLFVARVAVWPDVGAEGSSEALEIAVNAASSRDTDAPLGAGFVPDFDGNRSLFGVDFRWRRDRWLAAGEVIAARLAFTGGPVSRPAGWHATAGYMITTRSQVLLRWDAFRPDGIGPDNDLLIAGYNLWPSAITGVQVNYLIPLDNGDFGRHQVLVNFQLEF